MNYSGYVFSVTSNSLQFRNFKEFMVPKLILIKGSIEGADGNIIRLAVPCFRISSLSLHANLSPRYFTNKVDNYDFMLRTKIKTIRNTKCNENRINDC